MTLKELTDAQKTAKYLQEAIDNLATAADAVHTARDALINARKLASNIDDPEIARTIAQAASGFKLSDGGFYEAQAENKGEIGLPTR